MTKQSGRAADGGPLEQILKGEKSVEGPSLGNMLAPKYDIPSPAQDTATIKSSNRLSPQYQEQQVPTNYFVQQMTSYFQQHNLTDSAGNFRPGSEHHLPSYKNFLSPQSDQHVETLTTHNNDPTESSSPQDNDYVTAFTNEEDDLTRTGFMESNNDDIDNQRPGTEQSSYTGPGNYWYRYATVPSSSGTFERGVIASPQAPFNNLQSAQSSINTPSFTETASLIDEHSTENFEPGTRPGYTENQESGLKIGQTSDLRYRTSYPSPHKFGLNYFKDRKLEEEAREKERHKIEQQQKLKKKQNKMFYPSPIPLTSKNGSTEMKILDPVSLAKVKQQKAAAIEAMKVKVKVEQSKNGTFYYLSMVLFMIIILYYGFPKNLGSGNLSLRKITLEH